ncbi:ABC transporter substrate-binding protein [Aurantibacter crassamenti]|uniref:ABC transporter substrate-binding protein n=1 Tax=Aurantibacter crassamenti TaxID=1837375 RepID=UPI00193A885D|nr:ABC transporter substrate-binding protein [Aurantibacter crassamenti]MBM1107316.1 ABC transporter substrate-binding protein [Aurantibacter crassamenti]
MGIKNYLSNKFEIDISIESKWLCIVLLTFIGMGCQGPAKEVVNIGFIGPLTTRATDLGIGPSNAMKLAVSQYNANKLKNEPQINLFIEDDQWLKENAIPAYHKLKEEHNIKVLFISNTDGTMAVQNEILKDGVIVVNPLNSDDLLSTTNENTFRIAKKTEEANGIIAIRIIELGLKKVLFMQYPNDYMTRATNAAIDILKKANVEYEVVTVNIGEVDFTEEMAEYKAEGFDAYVFFGYKELGYAMKQARDLEITAPFFGSTVLLDPAFYDNSEGAIIGTECSFFTPADGNFVLANKFIEQYYNMYHERPTSIWPAMQAYDAMNLVLNELRNFQVKQNEYPAFSDWLRNKMKNVRYYQGICGNILISENRSSKGIYFSLYRYESKGNLEQVRR